MNSNLLLVAGPVIGLLAARLFGPLRPLSAFVAAVVGQVVLLVTWNLWQQHRAMRLLAAPPGGRDVMLMAHATHPTLGGRLLPLSFLLLITGVITMLGLGVQLLVMRQPWARLHAG